MNARTQAPLTAGDLELILALSRAGTLAAASERLAIDPSTAFRTLQRIERGLGQPIFVRTRRGYLATELAQALAAQAERVEHALEEARSVAQMRPDHLSGSVRITSTDTLLHGLVAPALAALHVEHPLLAFDLHAANEVASLTRRDADIAIRATRRPPQHLVGRNVGSIGVAVYGARRGPVRRYRDVEAGKAPWIAPDEALPDHPSVAWRKRAFPKVVPLYRVNSIHTVLELVAAGLGIGVLPIFLAERRADLIRLGEPIDEARTDLWILAHPESRHLRRVSTVYAHLVETLSLP